MRKSVLLFVMAVLLCMPVAVQAQAAAAFDHLTIQLWPEYDKPAVLVIYDFSVSAETALPGQIHLKLPAQAELLAIARQESGGLMNLEYDLPASQGDFTVLSFAVTDRSVYHIEFYLPYVRKDQNRSFRYTWTGDYAVQTLDLSVQEPVGAINFTTDPVMSASNPGQDGFTYYRATVENISAGKSLDFNIQYDKDNETLSASTLGVQPTAPLDQPVSGQSATLNFLPWILGGLGVVLIVGGGAWYWLASRTQAPGNSRKRHTSRSGESSGAEVYCSQCGKRAQGADRFCRACGARIQPREE
jgi:hypothetical protein